MRVPSPPPRRLSRSSIDLRDLEQERYEKVTHTDSAPSMIALHYATQQQLQVPCNKDVAAFQQQQQQQHVWQDALNDIQEPIEISIPLGKTNQTQQQHQTSSTSSNSPPALKTKQGNQQKTHINQLSSSSKNGCDTEQYQIFGGHNSDDSETNDYYDSINVIKQAPATCLPIAEDNKELKRLIEDNYLYFKKQTAAEGDKSEDSVKVADERGSGKYPPALSESDFIRMKNGENQYRSGKESTKKSFALSDSEFLRSYGEAKSKKKQLEALKEGTVASSTTTTPGAKEESRGSFNLKSLLAKTKRSSTECFSLEKKRHQTNSEEIPTNRSQLFKRSRNRKLSHSYNGGMRERQKSETRLRQQSDTDSDVYLPRLFSDSQDSTSRYNTPDILLDINILNEQSEDARRAEDEEMMNQHKSTYIQLIDLGANTIQEVGPDDLSFLKDKTNESYQIPSTPPPSLSPTSLIDSSIPEQLKTEAFYSMNEKSNVSIKSSSELAELFRSLSFPSTEQSFHSPVHQQAAAPTAHIKAKDSFKIVKKESIKQRMSTLSDQVLVNKNSSNFLMSPPLTPNFNSVIQLPTSKSPNLILTGNNGSFGGGGPGTPSNSINVYFLSPPPTATASVFPLTSPGNPIFVSDTSTMSLDVFSTLDVASQTQQVNNTQPAPATLQTTSQQKNISPKPEIILDSTLSPNLMRSSSNGSLAGEKKDSTSPQSALNSSQRGPKHTSLLTGYEGIQTVRKRQASVVTYDVNVINFSQDNSDSRSYIPMGRVSTSSASKY